MDIPMMDSYLESLAGYICDDDELVTYKWLSKELEVHVNVSKIILWRYWQNHKSDMLVATLMLIGNLKGGGMRVEVVRDRDVDRAKEKFEKIISEHVYSLQRTLVDIELLAGCSRGVSRYSAIICQRSLVMSSEEASILRWGKARTMEIATMANKAVQQALDKKECVAIKETPKIVDRSKENEIKMEEKVKKVSPPSKQKSIDKKIIGKKFVQSTKAGFGHLFGKAGNEQKLQPSLTGIVSDDNTSKHSDTPNEGKATKCPVGGSSNKGKGTKKEVEANVPKNIVGSAHERNEWKETDDAVVTKPENLEPSSTSKKGTAKKKKKSDRGTKRSRSQDFEDEKKKRKRIIVASESSEGSEAGSGDEDMTESTPPLPSPIKDKSSSPSPVRLKGNLRKVRKLVDKTFMDDNGYLITKKEHVYESGSDEELEVVELKKKLEPESSGSTKKAPAKMKQTSLMSFLKKR